MRLFAEMLKELYDSGVISAEECQGKRKKYLDRR
jgi:hypothetical protein